MPFEKWKTKFEEKRKNMKKGDWIALALTGVLLLVIALPSSSGSTKNGLQSQNPSTADTGAKNDVSEEKSDLKLEYAAYLEEKLEQALGEMEGAGKVKVMITLSDSGERVALKDTKEQSNEVTENDASGGNRTTKERQQEETTVYTESDSGTYPYVEREVYPKIEGVLVVAEGGGNQTVVSDISEVVMALFHVEAHKIKVVKMSSMEE